MRQLRKMPKCWPSCLTVGNGSVTQAIKETNTPSRGYRVDVDTVRNAIGLIEPAVSLIMPAVSLIRPAISLIRQADNLVRSTVSLVGPAVSLGVGLF